MIFAAQYAVVCKRTFQDKAFQTNINKIISTLPLNPEVSQMDAVVLGPKDVGGLNNAKIKAALAAKHDDVAVIYIASRDQELELIDCENKCVAKKITPQFLEEMVNSAITKKLSAGKLTMESRDDREQKLPGKAMSFIKGVFAEETAEEAENPAPAGTAADFLETDIDGSGAGNPAAGESEAALVEDIPVREESVRDKINAVRDFTDWNLFKEQMNKDVIVSSLMEENAKYVGVVNMLEVLNTKIMSVWMDKGLTADQKFERIRAIGVDRSILAAAKNDMITHKLIDIMEMVTISAKRTVEEQIDRTNRSLYKITANKGFLPDEEAVLQATEKRAALILDSMRLVKSIIELYQSMNLEVTAVVQALDDNLPSANEYINQMIKPVANVFTPENTAELAMLLMDALQKNRMTLSQLEIQVQSAIELISKIFKTDAEIIEYQNNMIQYLKANRVEDVVILDSMLKNCLRLYIGTPNSGRTATTLCWCGIQSRRNNSLLIDLTGNSKLGDYGVKVVSIKTFMTERIEEPFLCVEGSVDNTEELKKLVLELKTRINYYPYISILLDSKSQDIIEALSPEAFTATYITNCQKGNIEEMKRCYKEHTYSNIARKVVMIAPPIYAVNIAGRMDIDPTITQIITIPDLEVIKACELKGEPPFHYDEVVRIFEEAYR